MLLPVGAPGGPPAVTIAALTRTVEGRTVLARTRKPRTLVTIAIIALTVEARPIEIARAVARGAGIAAAAVVALLPGLVLAPVGTVAKILARPTRKSLLAIA